MFDYFNISYFILWLLVCLLTFANIQLAQKVRTLRNKRNPNSNELPLSDQGIGSGELFPEFPTTLNELGNWKRTSPAGSIVIITSFTCSSCKIVYPLIAPLLNKHPAVNFLVLLDGSSDDLESIRSDYHLNVPVYTVTEEMREPLKIRAFPFGYLLSPEGKVVAKGVVGHESALEVLLQKGQEQPKPSTKKLKTNLSV